MGVTCNLDCTRQSQTFLTFSDRAGVLFSYFCCLFSIEVGYFICIRGKIVLIIRGFRANEY